MELSIPRNHDAGIWKLDKIGRWRSKHWRTWIRDLLPVRMAGWPYHRSGDGFNAVIAAHFRYPGCGIGTRPADCFVYPMHDADHKAAHAAEQPPQWLQWLWCIETIAAGLRRDKLGGTPTGRDWIDGLLRQAVVKRADLSTPAIEQTGAQWARYFLDGELWIYRHGNGIL